MSTNISKKNVSVCWQRFRKSVHNATAEQDEKTVELPTYLSDFAMENGRVLC